VRSKWKRRGKTRRTRKVSPARIEYPLIDSSAYKTKLIIEQGGCQLPSCSCSGGSSNDYVQHHKDFWGKRENPLLAQKGIIDLLCKPECHDCHDRVHKIAAAIVFFLEKYKSIGVGKLIWAVVNLLGERCINVGFVLLKEFIPTGIVQMENWRCELAENGDRVANIKKYIEMRIELESLIEKIQRAA